MTMITKTEFARRHGFSPQYVTELLRRGILQEGDGGLLNAENADYALSLRKNLTHSKTEKKAELNELYIQARLQNEIEKGKLLKMETAEKEQSLIPADQVRETLFTKGRVIRDALMNIPDRISSLVASIDDESKVHDIISAEIRLCLEELCRNNGA